MKKNNVSNFILILVFLVGLSLLLYPTVSDYWNSFHQSWAITKYAEDVAGMDGDIYEAFWENARAYNRALLKKEDRYDMTAAEQVEYGQQLCISDSGIMGYIEIPVIDCSLPIYHGTDDSILQNAVGHLPGTSLPVGGESTHCVISGHRGLPSARLFTDLDLLDRGDVFFLHVLDETLTYEVDQIRIVEPHELSELQIVEGEDYCTLVTCTPYGVNSHRLLVRGHRIENQAASQSVRVTADAMQLEPVLVAPLVAAPMLLILLIALLVKTRRKK